LFLTCLWLTTVFPQVKYWAKIYYVQF
jgi:hypothetical protein